ncbi:MAG: CCDC90 family protein [Magnetococcus sp. MYC-9]
MSTTDDVAFAFDTHRFVKQMVATGFTEEQAEVQMRLLSEIWHAQLSTKADVAQVDAHVLELRRDMAAIEANLRRDIAAIEANLKRDIAILDGKVEATKETLHKEIETTKETLHKEIETTKETLRKEIETTKETLRKEIETTKETLRKEIEVAKNETIKWMVGLALAQLAMMAGILMTLVRVLPGGH